MYTHSREMPRSLRLGVWKKAELRTANPSLSLSRINVYLPVSASSPQFCPPFVPSFSVESVIPPEIPQHTEERGVRRQRRRRGLKQDRSCANEHRAQPQPSGNVSIVQRRGFSRYLASLGSRLEIPSRVHLSHLVGLCVCVNPESSKSSVCITTTALFSRRPWTRESGYAVYCRIGDRLGFIPEICGFRRERGNLCSHTHVLCIRRSSRC